MEHIAFFGFDRDDMTPSDFNTLVKIGNDGYDLIKDVDDSEQHSLIFGQKGQTANLSEEDMQEVVDMMQGFSEVKFTGSGAYTLPTGTEVYIEYYK